MCILDFPLEPEGLLKCKIVFWSTQEYQEREIKIESIQLKFGQELFLKVCVHGSQDVAVLLLVKVQTENWAQMCLNQRRK